MKQKTQKFFPSQRSREKGKVSVIFMGTPEFACPSLEKLIENEKVLAVVTQPDKPAGRGRKITSPPVKIIASKRNIPVYQPKDLKDPYFLEKIILLKPDLIVVVAFGRILPGELLDIPGSFSINLHPSLLPKYRGPAPIPWVLIKGEEKTGVTVQKMGEKIDEGDIILQKEVFIAPQDTSETLGRKLSYTGAQALIEAINLIKKGEVKLKPQEGKASYAPKIKKQMGEINWKVAAWKIHNLVRALNPSPGAFTTFRHNDESSLIKIWQTEVLEEVLNDEVENIPGSIIRIEKGVGFFVKTGKGTILVKQVQLPNRSRINAYDFIKGYHIKEGFILGG